MSQMPPVSLADGEFVLRQWQPDEAGVLTAMVLDSLEHLRPWQPFVRSEPVPVRDRVSMIERWASERTEGGDTIYGMFVDGVAVGNCGLHRRLGPSALELGYWVSVDHVRCGYATLAARLLTDAAFALVDVDHVEIHHDAANVASSGIPRRLGYRLVEQRPGGVGADGDTGIEWIWRMDRSGWLPRCSGSEAASR